MSTQFTIAEAAAKIGCHKSTISRHLPADQPRFGRTVVLTAADIKRLEKLVREGPGCPLFQSPQWQRTKGQSNAGTKRSKKNDRRTA